MWTMDELVERVRLALAAEYPGAPNGRVRDLPDRRAIRWYTTTGLVDRPAGMRGRSAVYGPRHLLQVVAVKRRQAQGHSLAEIQAELAGATDDALADVARVPEPLLATGSPAADDAPARARFWEISRLPDRWTIVTPLASPTTARAAETRTEAPALEGAASAAQGREGLRAGAPARETGAQPPLATPQTPARDMKTPTQARETGPGASSATLQTPARDTKTPTQARETGPEAPSATQQTPGWQTPRPVGGVALPGGVILVTPGVPTADDRAAIEVAARPLLDLLAERGLLTIDGRTS